MKISKYGVQLLFIINELIKGEKEKVDQSNNIIVVKEIEDRWKRYDIKKSEVDWLIKQTKMLQSIVDTWSTFDLAGTDQEKNNFFYTFRKILVENILNEREKVNA